MIVPTVGRIVWFSPHKRDSEVASYNGRVKTNPDLLPQPMAAFVTYVWNDRLVNLTVFDHTGVAFPRTSVPLLQDDDPKPEDGFFAYWMPYQKGQAAKAEALEKQIKGVA